MILFMLAYRAVVALWRQSKTVRNSDNFLAPDLPTEVFLTSERSKPKSLQFILK